MQLGTNGREHLPPQQKSNRRNWLLTQLKYRSTVEVKLEVKRSSKVVDHFQNKEVEIT